MTEPINVNTLASPVQKNELETAKTAPTLGDAEKSQNESSIDKPADNSNLKVTDSPAESTQINISNQAQDILKSGGESQQAATNIEKKSPDASDTVAINRTLQQERIEVNVQNRVNINQEQSDNKDALRTSKATQKENVDNVPISSSNKFFQVDTLIGSLDFTNTERNTAIPKDSIAAERKQILPDRTAKALQNGENDIEPKKFIESVETQKVTTEKNNDAKFQNNLVIENTQQQRDKTKQIFEVKGDIQQELEIINNKTLSEQQTSNKLLESNVTEIQSSAGFAENNFVKAIRNTDLSTEILETSSIEEENSATASTNTTSQDTGFDAVVTQRNATIVLPNVVTTPGTTDNIQIIRAPSPAPENINREENTQATLQVGLAAAENNQALAQQPTLTKPNQIETADDILGQTRREKIGSQVNIKV